MVFLMPHVKFAVCDFKMSLIFAWMRPYVHCSTVDRRVYYLAALRTLTKHIILNLIEDIHLCYMTQ